MPTSSNRTVRLKPAVRCVTEHVSRDAVVADGARVVTAVEKQHGALETHPVLLPGPLRRQLDLSLLVNQPVLHHQPPANTTTISHLHTRHRLQYAQSGTDLIIVNTVRNGTRHRPFVQHLGLVSPQKLILIIERVLEMPLCP